MTDVECSSEFEVAAPPTEVWRILTELRASRGEGDWWLPGFACRCPEVEVVEAERLVALRGEEPCKDTTIEITLEHIETGTRVRVVQSGFDPSFVAFAGGVFDVHAGHIFADFELCLTTGGAVVERAWLPWTMLGFDAANTGSGIVVASRFDGTWAEKIGIEPGDIVLTIGGAPIFTMHDFVAIEHVLEEGSMVAATWVRNAQTMHGEALA